MTTKIFMNLAQIDWSETCMWNISISSQSTCVCSRKTKAYEGESLRSLKSQIWLNRFDKFAVETHICSLVFFVYNSLSSIGLMRYIVVSKHFTIFSRYPIPWRFIWEHENATKNRVEESFYGVVTRHDFHITIAQHSYGVRLPPSIFS